MKDQDTNRPSATPAIPNCYQRGCEHLQGIINRSQEETENGIFPEAGERFYCKAFPEGIPDDIAYGDNLHLEPYPGDGGITFHKERGGKS